MSNPLYSSLSIPSEIKKLPYSEWIKLVTTTQELEELLRTFYGTPKYWVEWAERQTLEKIQRGIVVSSPLAYRVKLLWCGIILLQESKFICDYLENALRHSFIDYAIKNHITYAEIKIRGFDKVNEEYKKTTGSPVNLDLVVESNVASCLTFPQLTGTLVDNWYWISKASTSKKGFRFLFAKNRYCFEKKNFINDMEMIKERRNEVAHSKHLFLREDSEGLYRTANRWLTALGIRLSRKVLDYRTKRPDFLIDLDDVILE